MSYLRRLILALLLTTSSSWAAAQSLDSQLLGAELQPKSKARLVYVYGDRVAILEVERPPLGLVQILDAQRGPLFLGATRRRQIGERLEIALALARPNLMARSQWIEKSHRLAITISAPLAPPVPGARALIGRVPDLIPIAVAPPIMPPRLAEHPCPLRGPAQQLLDDQGKLSTAEKLTLLGQVVEDPCHSFLIGEAAKATILAFEPIDPGLERWAYQTARVTRWARYPAAHAYTSLIAANVLTERGLYTEAETLLLADRVIKAQSLAPYVAYSLARLYARSNRPEEADELLGRLLAAPLDARLAAASWSLRIETADRAGDYAKGLSLLRQARQKLGDKALLPNSWLRGAELALLSASAQEAESLFFKALETGDRRAHDHAELRLGDLAVAAAKKNWEREAEAHYARITEPDACFAALLEIRRISGKKIAGDKVLAGLERVREANVCSPAGLEAAYALARLEATWGNEQGALERIAGLRPESGWPAGMRDAMESIEIDLATSLLERRVREHRYTEVIELVAGRLQPLMARLPAEAQLALAESYLAVGLPERVEPILLPLLRRPTKERTALSMVMLDAYVANKDADRARLVLGYLKSQGDADQIALRLVAARLELAGKQPEKALAVLDQMPEAPAGDPAAEADYLRAEALLGTNRIEPAAEAYQRALSSAPDHADLGVRVISACARTCTPPRLTALLDAVKLHAPAHLEGERMRWLLSQRGMGTTTASTASIWSRLRAVDAIAAGNEPTP